MPLKLLFLLLIPLFIGFVWVEVNIGSEAIIARSLRGLGIRPIRPPVAYGISTAMPVAINENSVVFLGDSMTSFGNWVGMFPGLSVSNYGLAGDTTDGALGRLQEIINGRPRKLFIMIGINDFIWSKPISTIIMNYRQIIGRVRVGSPKTLIYVKSLLPVNYFLFSPGHRLSNSDVAKVNAELQKIATEFAVQYVDLFSHFADSFRLNQLYPRYTTDGLHLNLGGYLLWAWVLGPFISNHE